MAFHDLKLMLETSRRRRASRMPPSVIRGPSRRRGDVPSSTPELSESLSALIQELQKEREQLIVELETKASDQAKIQKEINRVNSDVVSDEEWSRKKERWQALINEARQMMAENAAEMQEGFRFLADLEEESHKRQKFIEEIQAQISQYVRQGSSQTDHIQKERKVMGEKLAEQEKQLLAERNAWEQERQAFVEHAASLESALRSSREVLDAQTTKDAQKKEIEARLEDVQKRHAQIVNALESEKTSRAQNEEKVGELAKRIQELETERKRIERQFAEVDRAWAQAQKKI